MTLNKKWGSVLLAAVLLMSPVSAVQANSTVPAVEETQFRNLAAGLPYEWSEEPEASRPDGGYKLTDGKYGTLDMNDPAWVGHQRGKTREVVFDLGEEKSIGKITAHFFQDYPTNSILVPLTVSMYVSDDKEHWGLLSIMPPSCSGGMDRQDRRPLNGTAAGMESKAGIRTASWHIPVMSKSPLPCILHSGATLTKLKFWVQTAWQRTP